MCDNVNTGCIDCGLWVMKNVTVNNINNLKMDSRILILYLFAAGTFPYDGETRQDLFSRRSIVRKFRVSFDY